MLIIIILEHSEIIHCDILVHCEIVNCDILEHSEIVHCDMFEDERQFMTLAFTSTPT